MTRFFNKLTGLMLALALLVSIFRVDTMAAGGLSISSSASSVSEGGTFTVTVKAANDYFVAGINLSVSGGSVVSGLGKSSLDSGESTTAKIKLTGNSCTVSVSGTAANYTTETEGSASASVTVKKKAVSTTEKKPETTTAKPKPEEPAKSSNNKLSSLTVSEGTLTPAFSADTTSYKVEYPATTTKATISAKAADAKATVSGIGEKTLNAGDNNFEIICKAENGSTKTYTVNLYVDETPLVYTTYGEKELGVVRNQTNIGIPATFELATVTIEEQEVQAYHSNQYGMTLVYLVNEAGEKDFYMFEEEKGVTSIFRPAAILGRNIVLYDLTEEEKVREHMVFQEITIDGITVNGWIYDVEGYENYALIPVMNEFGEKVIYQYEKTENTMQLYKEFVPPVEEAPEEPPMVDIRFLYGAGGAAVFFLLTTIISMVKSRKLKKRQKIDIMN